MFLLFCSTDMNNYVRDHPEAFAEPHPAMPVLKSSDHHNHHDDSHHHHGENHNDFDFNLNVNVGPHPGEEDEEEKNTVSSAVVGGVAFAIAFAVFTLMSLIIVCINQSHKQAMTAITLANHRLEKT